MTESQDDARSPTDQSERTDADVERNGANQKSDENGGQERPKTASNAKDPSRPRRKKARRACLACQRAHLTCGMCFA